MKIGFRSFESNIILNGGDLKHIGDFGDLIKAKGEDHVIIDPLPGLGPFDYMNFFGELKLDMGLFKEKREKCDSAENEIQLVMSMFAHEEHNPRVSDHILTCYDLALHYNVESMFKQIEVALNSLTLLCLRSVDMSFLLQAGERSRKAKDMKQKTTHLALRALRVVYGITKRVPGKRYLFRDCLKRIISLARIDAALWKHISDILSKEEWADLYFQQMQNKDATDDLVCGQLLFQDLRNRYNTPGLISFAKEKGLNLVQAKRAVIQGEHDLSRWAAADSKLSETQIFKVFSIHKSIGLKDEECNNISRQMNWIRRSLWTAEQIPKPFAVSTLNRLLNKEQD